MPNDRPTWPASLPLEGIDQPVQVSTHTLRDDGLIPNSHLPLLVYQNAFRFPEGDPAAVCERVFAANRWGRSWRNGIYPYHHYHSTAHEVLGICGGEASVQFGGESGVILSVRRGDVVVIPAGVGHKRLSAGADLLVVGAYPPDQDPDLRHEGERAQVLRSIARVALPPADPVYGEQGPLMDLWGKNVRREE